MKFLLLAFFALASTQAFAAAPPVTNLNQTPCFLSVKALLATEYNKLREVDGMKIGSELLDLTDFTKLPTREYAGMGGDYHFGLVGYMRVLYHGDAVDHLYNYVVSAACVYSDEKKAYVLDNELGDENTSIENISVKSMDFER